MRYLEEKQEKTEISHPVSLSERIQVIFSKLNIDINNIQHRDASFVAMKLSGIKKRTTDHTIAGLVPNISYTDFSE